MSKRPPSYHIMNFKINPKSNSSQIPLIKLSAPHPGSPFSSMPMPQPAPMIPDYFSHLGKCPPPRTSVDHYHNLINIKRDFPQDPNDLIPYTKLSFYEVPPQYTSQPHPDVFLATTVNYRLIDLLNFLNHGKQGIMVHTNQCKGRIIPPMVIPFEKYQEINESSKGFCFFDKMDKLGPFKFFDDDSKPRLIESSQMMRTLYFDLKGEDLTLLLKGVVNNKILETLSKTYHCKIVLVGGDVHVFDNRFPADHPVLISRRMRGEDVKQPCLRITYQGNNVINVELTYSSPHEEGVMLHGRDDIEEAISSMEPFIKDLPGKNKSVVCLGLLKRLRLQNIINEKPLIYASSPKDLVKAIAEGRPTDALSIEVFSGEESMRAFEAAIKYYPTALLDKQANGAVIGYLNNKIDDLSVLLQKVNRRFKERYQSGYFCNYYYQDTGALYESHQNKAVFKEAIYSDMMRQLDASKRESAELLSKVAEMTMDSTKLLEMNAKDRRDSDLLLDADCCQEAPDLNGMCFPLIGNVPKVGSGSVVVISEVKIGRTNTANYLIKMKVFMGHKRALLRLYRFKLENAKAFLRNKERGRRWAKEEATISKKFEACRRKMLDHEAKMKDLEAKGKADEVRQKKIKDEIEREVERKIRDEEVNRRKKEEEQMQQRMEQLRVKNDELKKVEEKKRKEEKERRAEKERLIRIKVEAEKAEKLKAENEERLRAMKNEEIKKEEEAKRRVAEEKDRKIEKERLIRIKVEAEKAERLKAENAERLRAMKNEEVKKEEEAKRRVAEEKIRNDKEKLLLEQERRIKAEEQARKDAEEKAKQLKASALSFEKDKEAAAYTFVTMQLVEKLYPGSCNMAIFRQCLEIVESSEIESVDRCSKDPKILASPINWLKHLNQQAATAAKEAEPLLEKYPNYKIFCKRERHLVTKAHCVMKVVKDSGLVKNKEEFDLLAHLIRVATYVKVFQLVKDKFNINVKDI
jgi:hypothetical protein